jgi:hypothetical protein
MASDDPSILSHVSIGTNDLIQYTLALDRGNPDVAHLGSPLASAVLKLLDITARAAADHAIPASMCGDMAADPLALPPLYESLDPDMLDQLFAESSAAIDLVCFRVADWDVLVHGDGRLQIYEPTDPTPTAEE